VTKTGKIQAAYRSPEPKQPRVASDQLPVNWQLVVVQTRQKYSRVASEQLPVNGQVACEAARTRGQLISNNYYDRRWNVCDTLVR
jgi:hypothetical protein